MRLILVDTLACCPQRLCVNNRLFTFYAVAYQILVSHSFGVDREDPPKCLRLDMYSQIIPRIQRKHLQEEKCMGQKGQPREP